MAIQTRQQQLHWQWNLGSVVYQPGRQENTAELPSRRIRIRDEQQQRHFDILIWWDVSILEQYR